MTQWSCLSLEAFPSVLFHDTVNSLSVTYLSRHNITVAGLVLLLVVTGERILDVVREAVLGVGIVLLGLEGETKEEGF